jgi:rubrerythrin
MRVSLAVISMIGAMLSSAPARASAPSGTLNNLNASFDGESNAHARYVAFAAKADQEGYPQVARLFRAAARAEQIHAGNHAEVIRSLGGTPKAVIGTVAVKSTAENLQAALAGESYERDTMYPSFLAEARKDGDAKAIRTLTLARTAEIEHARLYQEALSNLEAMRQPGGPIYVCGVCGYTTTSLPAAKCPSSFSPRERFERID